MDGLNREMEIRFGTTNPVAFKDQWTGEEFQFRAFGVATVVIKDPAKFPSVDDVKRDAPLVIYDAFIKAVSDLDGSLDAAGLNRSKKQLERKTAENINGSGLMATAVELMQLALTPESEEKIKAGMSKTPMTDDHPMPANQNSAVTLPKFCPNCGAKAGSRFCPNCGSKLG